MVIRKNFTQSTMYAVVKDIKEAIEGKIVKKICLTSRELWTDCTTGGDYFKSVDVDLIVCTPDNNAHTPEYDILVHSADDPLNYDMIEKDGCTIEEIASAQIGRDVIKMVIVAKT